MSTPHAEPIAVVGIGLRFPGGNTTPGGFAEFLRDGRSGLRPLPTDRWDPVDADQDGPGAPGVIRCAQGGFIDKVDHFDAKFFNISPKEADYVDPQHRVALEVAWEALEDAGIDPVPLRHGTGGVYMAVSNVDYVGEMSAYSVDELNTYMATGATFSALSGRLSYFLGWRGPCMTVDTACSASLVAVHLAAQGLRAGETDLALCGGVNTIHSPRPYAMASSGNMLAPDGVCKTFDDAADGYCRSEGCGVIVLKRLSDARRDGDRIYALVRGSAVGQDGESSSLMVPNGTAQERLIRTAVASAGLEPGDVSYVEAHGTGTPLGDPIEMGALGAVFGDSHTRENPLAVASLKTNIGHMESAAGIGGVIKTVLQMQEGALYPHLNLDTPSQRIPWEDLPVTVPTEKRPWTADTRRAVVSSFGLTGIIGSVVLEEAPPETPAGPAAPAPPGEAHVLTLSARSPGALRGQVQRYQRLLRDRPETDVADLCHAAATARAHFDLRTAGVVRDHDDVARFLDNALTRSTRPGRPSAAPQVAFLFSGGGTQYVGMGRPLYERFAAFREHLDACDRLFTPHLGRSIRDMVLGDADDAELIHQIRYMQPALFALEYAVARLWLSWGIRPSVLAGHSIGEIVAATVAGLFSLDDAVTLMAARARLMDASPPGAMAAAEASPAEVADLLAEHDDLSVAAVNGARQIVLSGGKASLESVEEALAGRGVKTRRLAVSCASHSPLMAEATEELRSVAGGLTFHPPEFTLVSNLTGRVADPAELSTPDYWARHLREPVRFEEGVRAVAERGRHAFLEAGPASELIGMGKQVLDAPGDHLWLSSLHAEDADGTVARQSLAQLYAAGVPVSWAGYYGDRPPTRLTLPTYAFDRRRHWLPAPGGADAARGGGGVHPLLGREVSTDEQRAAGIRTFSTRLDARRPYLADHKVMGRVVFPAAGYVETVLALQDAVYGETSLPVTGVTIHEALLLPDEGTVELRTRLRTGPGEPAEVEIVSLVESEDPGAAPLERRHFTATVDADGLADTGAAAGLDETARSLHVLADRAGEPRSRRPADDLYADFAELGVEYGPHYQGVRSIDRYGDHLAVGDLRGREATSAEHLPPAVLDAALQTLTALAADDTLAMPVGFGRCRLLRKPRGHTLRSVLRTTPPAAGEEGELPTVDLLILDGDRTVFVLEGLTLRRVANAAPDRDRMYAEVRWVKRSLQTGAGEPRRVLLVGAPPAGLDALAGPAKERDVTLSVAATTAEAVALLRKRPTDVCWFWRPPQEPGEPLPAECERNYRDLLALRDALEETGFGQAQRLWLVTEAGQWVPGDRPEGPDGVGQVPPAAATLWGFGHVMWTEYPSYGVTLVDLPRPAADGADAGAGYPWLLDEWTAMDSADFQVAYRSGVRHVRRVSTELGGPRTEVELVTGDGQIGVVAVPLAEEPAPTGGRTRVRVHAAGLNYVDAANALGLHRAAEEVPDALAELPLGMECAGVVTAAGPDAAFRVGDAVVAAHLGVLRREVTVESETAVRKPARLGFAEAAALPIAYLTAHHALHDLAGMRRGDRVLIHSAAGGVGQAAVRLAQRAGAEVLTTASPQKWSLLRAQGIRHVMNSRTLTFPDEVLAATDGHGADIVLHSLGGDRVESSLRSLGRDGRFVELGNVGTWTPDEIRRVRPDVAYHTFDFMHFTAEQRLRLIRDVLGPVMELTDAGELTPLPTTVYAVDEVDEACRAIGRGTNVGKLVVGFDDWLGAEPPPAARPAHIDADHTYLVTGGFGALGRLVAERLAALGARHIALLGRHTPADEDLAALRARLGPDTELVAYAADIGDAGDVERVFTDLRARAWPLGGIVHAAGTLADAPVAAQTWESIDTIFRTKVYGSWLLHQAALSLPELRFFIGYSTVTSILGNGGQANYAAGSAFLDTLMCRRHAAGLPGTSVNWGAWGEIGLAAAADAQHAANVERQGFTFFRPAAGIRALFRLLERPPAQVTIAEVDWDRFAATRPQHNALYQKVVRGPRRRTADVDPDALLALPPAERRETVSRVLRGLIADLLHYDSADEVSPDARFFEVGLDSLAAVELKNALELCFRLPLSATSIFDHPSVSQLATFVDGQLTAAAGRGNTAGGDNTESTNGDTR
ncbi:SDR family oxidoreductase [Streptomyces sp. WMMC500]|uniref:type I polyketide synthase n=1 Tax=Streptomyces sp. WMMC500 TaxID=3015154 RepID=UPI00248CE59B|nr:type I polyketide synthase [Streptomyces sp. WMMC500]WBB61311.1 SDR family oxidoreductase [Streptomyces sp. WMMC500]